jgi:hypothetical protein
MRSLPNVAPRTNSDKGLRDNEIHNFAGYPEKTPNWVIGGQSACTAKGNSGNRIAPGYGGNFSGDAGNSGRVATDQAARRAELIRRNEEFQARKSKKSSPGQAGGGAGFPLSGGYDSKSRSIQARGGATLKTERAAVLHTAAPRHR